MGILDGILLTLFVPQIIKEDISRKVLTKKLALAAIMFVGLVLIGK